MNELNTQADIIVGQRLQRCGNIIVYNHKYLTVDQGIESSSPSENSAAA
jgi:hypothetical protein